VPSSIQAGASKALLTNLELMLTLLQLRFDIFFCLQLRPLIEFTKKLCHLPFAKN
jgi:hypothetical protein